MKRKRLLSQQESLKLAQQLDSVSSIMSPSKKKNATRISTPIQQPMNHQTNVSGRREVFHQKQNNSMAYNRTLPIYDAETSLNNNHYGFTKISPHGKGNTSTPQPPHHRTLEGGDGGSDGGKPGPGTDHPPLFDCENYFLFEDCTSNATVGHPRVFSESEAAYGEMILCVGEKHKFVVYIALTSGNYQMELVCLDNGMTLAMQDFPQPITIKKIEWSCEGALPAKGEGFTYEPKFPEVGTYQVKATVHINPPELCYSGKLILNASPKLVHAVVVESITSFNGYSDGQILPYGGHKEINLQANLSTPPENFKPDWLDWEVSPSEAGVLKPIPELPEEAIFRKFIPNEEFMGEVTIYAKLCPEYWGAEFHLKIVGGIRVSGDKDILCAGHEDIINLKATTDISGISGEQISWNLKPKEAGKLKRATGYGNQFISNPEYVSSEYQDIVITAALFDEKDDVKATCLSLTLKSKGVKKNEFSNETTGINPPQDGPWNSELEGRLFVDTTEDWEGPCIDEDDFDKQQVLFYVEVTPNENGTFGIENLEIDWELFDPDDPADNPLIDPYPPADNPLIDPYPRYDPSKDPLLFASSRDTDNRGVDNTGIPYEADSYWLTGGNIYKEPTNFDEQFSLTSNEIIGKAHGKFIKKGGKLHSSVYFNFSDHGGDNFILKAILYDTKKQRELCSVKTGKLTVWRKRCAQIMAMSRKEPGEGNFYPSPSGTGDRKEITKALQGAYGNSDKDKNAYIDFYVVGAKGNTNQGKDSLYLPHRESFKNSKDVLNYVNENISNLKDKKATYSPYIILVGVDKLWQGKSQTGEETFTVGNATQGVPNPFIVIAVGKLEEETEKYAKTRRKGSADPSRDILAKRKSLISSTIIHEIGHKLAFPDTGLINHLYQENFQLTPDDFHHNEIPKTNLDLIEEVKWWNENCYFQGFLKKYSIAKNICKRHIRILRNSTARYFWITDWEKWDKEKDFSLFLSREGDGEFKPISWFYD